MQLGTYVEVRSTVPDIAAALATYTRLGFKPVGDAIVTDGGLNIHLQTEPLPGPTLAYYGSDLAALRAAGVPVNDNAITDPNGVQLWLSADAAPAPMPPGGIMERQPVSRLGKFGEYAIPVDNFERSATFWKNLGFQTLHSDTNPYPWGIFADALIVVGLHQVDPASGQPTFSTPHITYFAGDMPDRIAAVKQAGLPVTDLPPEENGQFVHASLSGPGGQAIFMFQGEI
jgi:catechol 2,3-dioxygenase-like lactoylglutathione lyase family enzyme